jgi:hypothetical protein
LLPAETAAVVVLMGPSAEGEKEKLGRGHGWHLLQIEHTHTHIKTTRKSIDNVSLRLHSSLAATFSPVTKPAFWHNYHFTMLLR